MKEVWEKIKTEVRSMREDLKTTVHEAIDERIEASGGINTSLLDKRLGEMEKRLAEKMDSLDVQAEPTHVVRPDPNLVDASEEPVVATFVIVASIAVCWSHFVCHGRQIV